MKPYLELLEENVRLREQLARRRLNRSSEDEAARLARENAEMRRQLGAGSRTPSPYDASVGIIRAPR